MKKHGYTMLEIMIVITLIALIAAFALPEYGASIDRAHERDMTSQMTAVHGASLVFAAQNNGNFWDDGGGTETDISVINSNLNTNLISSDGTTFSYDGSGTSFTATASWGGFTITVTEAQLDPGTNPSCSGACP